MELTIDRLKEAVENASAIRRRRCMQPAGGKGDKLFPPTYPGEKKSDPPRHVFEVRHGENGPELCVLLDSVSSQANRLECALKELRERNALRFPTICVDFSDTPAAEVGVITSLDAPHRFCDAILRDSLLGKEPFRKSPDGTYLFAATPANAQALYEIDPASINHGAWNSNGGLGAFGTRFTRSVTSEIVGVGVATESGRPSGKRTSSRIDPLGIVSAARVHKLPGGEWSFDSPDDKPSEILHGNIKPSVQDLGVSIAYAMHTFVLSLTLFRTIRFPKVSRETAVHARAALVALELAAAVGQDLAGYFLRSRCHLVPTEPGTPQPCDASGVFEIVNADGSREPCEFDLASICKVVAIAAGRAAEGGLGWRDKDLMLTPQPKLVELIQRSRQHALQSDSKDEQEDQ